MLRCLTFLLLLLPIVNHAQYGAKPKQKELDIAGTKIRVPNGCTSTSPKELECDTYKLKWVYFAPEDSAKLETMVSGAVTSQGEYKASRSRENCLLLGQPAKCFRNKSITDRRLVHQIRAYRVINKQPVILHLSLYSDREVVTNEDLPEPACAIFQFHD